MEYKHLLIPNGINSSNTILYFHDPFLLEKFDYHNLFQYSNFELFSFIRFGIRNQYSHISRILGKRFHLKCHGYSIMYIDRTEVLEALVICINLLLQFPFKYYFFEIYCACIPY